MKAGAPRIEALQHGEAGLTSVPPAEAEELLVKLAAIAEKPTDVVDLYERQISRCKAPADRVRALARAAQVAASKGQIDRARGFFELALSGTPTDDTLAALEQAAREGDSSTGGERLRRALCASMANGGQGARDGGKTRGCAHAASGVDGAPRSQRPRAGLHLARRRTHRPRRSADPRRARGARARGGRPAPRRGDAHSSARRGVRRARWSASSSRGARSCGGSSSTTRPAPPPTSRSSTICRRTTRP